MVLSDYVVDILNMPSSPFTKPSNYLSHEMLDRNDMS
jgi:hypothetical protein